MFVFVELSEIAKCNSFFSFVYLIQNLFGFLLMFWFDFNIRTSYSLFFFLHSKIYLLSSYRCAWLCKIESKMWKKVDLNILIYLRMSYIFDLYYQQKLRNATIKKSTEKRRKIGEEEKKYPILENHWNLIEFAFFFE